METIDDIVREMRESGKRCSGYMEMTLCDLADRIEAASKFISSVAERADHDLAELNSENERLRAALKPVLECDCWILETGKSRATDGGVSAIKAVRDAKRIYNESNNGESHS